MKKSLFAIAAVTAFAGAAQAQSSVTVYGVMDIGIGGYNSRVADGKAVNKTTGFQAYDNGESTSRIGFKGNEDLGGGASAFFTVELGLNPDAAQAIKTTGTQNRQTFVGLKKNGLGDIALGTQYTTVYNAVAKTDAGNTNNFQGDLIYTANTGGANAGNGTGNGDSFTIRSNQMVTLNSETYAGFQAHAMAILNNNNSTQTTLTNGASTTVSGGINNQNGWGLGLDYTWNKLFVTANYMGLTAKNPYVNVSSNGQVAAEAPVAAFGAGQASTNGSNVQDNQFYVGGTYDFGILKAYAQYITRKVSLQQNSGQYFKRSAEQIGVRSFITPTIEAWVSGGLGRVTGNGAVSNASGQPTANLTGWQIGSNYWLSKRTNLYAIYGQVNTSNVSVISTAGAGGNPASGNGSNYGVGVRHTF
jgi:predicted porin